MQKRESELYKKLFCKKSLAETGFAGFNWKESHLNPINWFRHDLFYRNSLEIIFDFFHKKKAISKTGRFDNVDFHTFSTKKCEKIPHSIGFS